MAAVAGDPGPVVDRLRNPEAVVPGPVRLRCRTGFLTDLLVDDRRHGVGADGNAELLSVRLTNGSDAGSEVVGTRIARVYLRLEVEKDATLVILAKKSDSVPENVRGISTGARVRNFSQKDTWSWKSASTLTFGNFFSKSSTDSSVRLARSSAPHHE
ncbi:hypothetical protein [Streptomyces sp. NPDC093094]|uniref:hypothetical protein n=1 Tax=Streptomyces sp. NPDC093094 TaxID=3366026 RepID=UPI0038282990